MWLPFRRRAAADAGDPPPPPMAPADTQSWADLGPLGRSTMPTVAAPASAFRTGLAAAQPFPLAVAPLSHGIDLEAPSGVVDGLAVARPSPGRRDELVLAPPHQRRGGTPVDEGSWWPMASVVPAPGTRYSGDASGPDPSAIRPGGELEVSLQAVPAREIVPAPGPLTSFEAEPRPLPGRYRSAQAAVEAAEETLDPQPIQPAPPAGRTIVRRTLGESRRMGLGPPLTVTRGEAAVASDPSSRESVELPLAARLVEVPSSGDTEADPQLTDRRVAVMTPDLDAGGPGEDGAAVAGEPAETDDAPLVGGRLHSELVAADTEAGEPPTSHPGVHWDSGLSMPLIERPGELPPGIAAGVTGDVSGDIRPQGVEADGIDTAVTADDTGQRRGHESRSMMPPHDPPFVVARTMIAGGLGRVGEPPTQIGPDAPRGRRRAQTPAPSWGSVETTPDRPPQPASRAVAAAPLLAASTAAGRSAPARGINAGLGIVGSPVSPSPAAGGEGRAALDGSRRLGALLTSASSAPAMSPGTEASAAGGGARLPMGSSAPTLTLHRLPAEAAGPSASASAGPDSEIGRLLAEIGSASGATVGSDGSISFAVPALPGSENGGSTPMAGTAAVVPAAGETAGHEAGRAERDGQHQSAANLDELAGKLYEHIRRRLKTELLVDRERAGMASDLR